MINFSEQLQKAAKNIIFYTIGSICYAIDFMGNKEMTIEKSKNKLPKKYIINKGATILFWEDDTKTIVKRNKEDEHNPRLAFLTAYFQKNSGLSRNKANKYLDSLVEEDE